MGFKKNIETLSEKIKGYSKYIDSVGTVRDYSVALLLKELGFNVNNPEDAVPSSEHGITYGLLSKEGYPLMSVKCLKRGSDLRNTIHRGHTINQCRYTLISDGIEYRFYINSGDITELDLSIDITKVNNKGIENLRKYCKDNLSRNDEADILEQFKETLNSELNNPSNEFVSFFINKLPSQYRNIEVPYNKVFKDAVSSLNKDDSNKVIEEQMAIKGFKSVKSYEGFGEVDGEFTSEEWEALHKVRGIIGDLVPDSRMVCRKQEQYIGVYIDNNRKTVCRLHFGSRKKTIQFPELPVKDKGIKAFQTPSEIKKVDDLDSHTITILDMASVYLNKDVKVVKSRGR